MSEAFIAKKLCNFLIPEAEADLGLYSAAAKALGLDPHTTAINAVLEDFRKFYGGLWVGGTAYLTSNNLSFNPNAMNRAVHKRDYSLSIPLVEILEIAPEFGLISGIVRITTKTGTMRLRCFGAKKFLSQIKDLCPHLRP